MGATTERRGVRIGLTLTAPPREPLLYPRTRTLIPTCLACHLGHWLGHFSLDRATLWATLILVVGPISFKETGSLLLLFLYFSVLLVCSLNFYLNFVSIPANSCNLVEYFL
jgi:hypothetical protein